MLHADYRLTVFIPIVILQEYYTQEAWTGLIKNNLKSVLLRHYPSLKNTGIAKVRKCFRALG
jgi:hypothetical protein